MNRPDFDDRKQRNRDQFGANADNYATSTVHARGESLARLVELLDPAPNHQVLDIATGAGHTALAFAPRVETVVATDLTPEMIELTGRRAAELGLGNVTTRLADAESLPFDDSRFDLVTCRIAPHHFPHPERFVAEVARVLRPGGRFGLVDNIVPADAAVADYYNRWEARRDPSHVRALSMSEWTELVEGAGMTILCSETMRKRMRFSDWVENMDVPQRLRPELLDRLFDAPAGVIEFLRPRQRSIEEATFTLGEGIVIAQR